MERSEWEGRVGRKWADEWRRTDRAFSGLTDRLLNRVRAWPMTRALDIGCGAGEMSLALARGHPASEVIGLDVSADLIEVARKRAAHLGNVTFLVADAADWRSGIFAPDLLVSRHGVMFFDDPVVAFANLLNGAAPAARLAFSCFRDRALNPWAAEVTRLLPPEFVTETPAGAPGPFAFADRDRVRSILSAAGWDEIAFEAADFAYVVGTGQDALEDGVSFLSVIGPAARASAGMDQVQRAAFADSLRRHLEQAAQDEMVALPAAAWIVTARAG